MIEGRKRVFISYRAAVRASLVPRLLQAAPVARPLSMALKKKVLYKSLAAALRATVATASALEAVHTAIEEQIDATKRRFGA